MSQATSRSSAPSAPPASAGHGGCCCAAGCGRRLAGSASNWGEAWLGAGREGGRARLAQATVDAEEQTLEQLAAAKCGNRFDCDGGQSSSEYAGAWHWLSREEGKAELLPSEDERVLRRLPREDGLLAVQGCVSM